MLKDYQILDCTLRDGGYKTQWHFSPGLVSKYVDVCNEFPLEYLEIGYCHKRDAETGEFRSLPLTIIRDIVSQSPIKLAAMIDAREFENVNDVVDQIIPYRGLLSLIRISLAQEELEFGVSIAHELCVLGFDVALNVMRINQYLDNLNTLRQLASSPAKYIYLVDTFGSCVPEEVAFIFQRTRSMFPQFLGFHGHDNLTMAFINSLSAIDNGADIIDGTFFGMGHGGGNLRTELILAYMAERQGKHISYHRVDSLVPYFESEGLGAHTKNVTNLITGFRGLRQRD